MFIILLPILIIVTIILLVLSMKNLLSTKSIFKYILIILLILILLFLCFKLYVKRNNIIFFFQSLKYENIDKYDYNNDIKNNGYISKDGAIKIAKEKTNEKRISKVTCELVQNGTYPKYNNILDIGSSEEKQATFWLITFSTGWDSYGHEENWYFIIDYYTGEVLYYNAPIYD